MYIHKYQCQHIMHSWSFLYGSMLNRCSLR